MKKVVSILGTPYTIKIGISRKADKYLSDSDGYCDPINHLIVIAEKNEEYSDDEWARYSKICLRHEIVHAFMFESGIDGNCKWDIQDQTHPEFMVSWIANQFPKLIEAFNKVDAI